ncbi:hypothetical protein [Runella aurantiaca]|uniref:hypothetical protein n=1 Tax=Runella aurantiaca TaxID=2282308 RepID=UPI0013145988|nr:hypothetical protein [Runella aurantiaca]
MKKHLFFYFLFLIILQTKAQPSTVKNATVDKKLTAQPQEAIKGVRGDIGVYVGNVYV